MWLFANTFNLEKATACLYFAINPFGADFIFPFFLISCLLSFLSATTLKIHTSVFKVVAKARSHLCD